MSFREITDIVERNDAAETKFGIRIAGLFASIDSDRTEDNGYAVEINGEIESISGVDLGETVEIQFISQNERGQNIGMSSLYLMEDIFSGYEAFSQRIYCKGIPARLRIVPKKG